MPRGSAAAAVVDTPLFADASDVEEFAKDLPEKFLYCREMGHNWRPHSAGRYADGGFERILRCSRCTTKRVQEITSRGVVLRNQYIHPEGYLSKGMGRIVGEGRGVLRLEAIKRIVAKAKK